MSTLHLTLKKKWFDMIASGEKKEEYREVKPYWINRLTWHEFHKLNTIEMIHALQEVGTIRQDYDYVEFKNGYQIDSPSVTVELIKIRYGSPANTKWIDGNPENWYFVLELGKIITNDNN